MSVKISRRAVVRGLLVAPFIPLTAHAGQIFESDADRFERLCQESENGVVDLNYQKFKLDRAVNIPEKIHTISNGIFMFSETMRGHLFIAGEMKNYWPAAV